ncbi:MAG TPA: hypothetical protein VGD84_10385 [Pseudonocardiaceae bacterium]
MTPVSNVVTGYAFAKTETRRPAEEALAAMGYRPQHGCPQAAPRPARIHYARAVDHLVEIGRRRIAAIGQHPHRGTVAQRLAAPAATGLPRTELVVSRTGNSTLTACVEQVALACSIT